MDEPCAALGPAETRMVLDTIRRLKAEGIGIFLISHDMSDVFEVCDRVDGDEERRRGRYGAAWPT